MWDLSVEFVCGNLPGLYSQSYLLVARQTRTISNLVTLFLLLCVVCNHSHRINLHGGCLMNKQVITTMFIKPTMFTVTHSPLREGEV